MNKYTCSVEEHNFRTVLAHSCLEAIWVLFGPSRVTGYFDDRTAHIIIGNHEYFIEQVEDY